MRPLVPFSRLIYSARAGLLVAGALFLAGVGRAQGATDLADLRARATQGDLEAQNALGNAYTNGQSGLQADHVYGGTTTLVYQPEQTQGLS